MPSTTRSRICVFLFRWNSTGFVEIYRRITKNFLQPGQNFCLIVRNETLKYLNSTIVLATQFFLFNFLRRIGSLDLISIEFFLLFEYYHMIDVSYKKFRNCLKDDVYVDDMSSMYTWNVYVYVNAIINKVASRSYQQIFEAKVVKNFIDS